MWVFFDRITWCGFHLIDNPKFEGNFCKNRTQNFDLMNIDSNI